MRNRKLLFVWLVDFGVVAFVGGGGGCCVCFLEGLGVCCFCFFVVFVIVVLGGIL